jgi:hypothetical protein
MNLNIYAKAYSLYVDYTIKNNMKYSWNYFDFNNYPKYNEYMKEAKILLRKEKLKKICL